MADVITVTLVHRLRLAALLASGSLLAGTGALANPQGAVVVQGEVTLERPDAATLLIRQGSKKAIVHYRSFDIAAGEHTRIEQPDGSAAHLGRVTGGDPTSIQGRLSSNGKVFLVNRAGIVLGAGSRVDVGGLVATTADIADADFLAGRYRFDRASPVAGAGVTNEGTITVAEHGLAALVAPTARNAGTIAARLGKVVVAGAETFTLDLDGDGLLAFATGPAASSVPVLAETTGTISADGGWVLLTARAAAGVVDRVVNVEGVIEARSVAADRGAIVLDGDAAGEVRIAGRIAATGAAHGATGGSVAVLGEGITVASGARVDAWGDAGGGTVQLGGAERGTGPRQARRVRVERGATIAADAVAGGDGGSIVVWSTEATRFAGSASARGGQAFGNGGFIEVSGQDGLAFTGKVDLAAPAGAHGRLLLDPRSITIAAETIDDGELGDGSILEGDGEGAAFVISTAALTAALDTGDVRLEASDGITLSQPLVTTGNTRTSQLTLLAGRMVALDAAISLKGGLAVAADTIRLRADVTTTTGQSYAGAVELGTSVTLRTAEGALAIAGTVAGTARTLGLDAGTGTIGLALGSGPAPLLGALGAIAGSGIALSGNLSTSGDQAFESGVTLTAGTVLTSTGGAVGFRGTLDADPAAGTPTLAVSAPTGAVTFGQAVGGSRMLGALTVGADAVSLGGGVNAAGPVTLTGAGLATTALSLAGDVTIDTAAAAGAVAINGPIDGAAHDLAIRAGAAGITLGGTVTVGSLDLAAAGIVLHGDVTSAGTQTYAAAVELGTSLRLTTGSGGLSFLGPIDDDAAPAMRALTIAAGTGAARFAGPVGSIRQLASLDVTGGTIGLAGNVTTQGAQTYRGPVELGGDVRLAAINAFIGFSAAVTDDAAAPARSLTVVAGAVGFGGPIGTAALPLGRLEVTAGTITLTGDVTTTDAQTYAGAVELASPVRLVTADAAVRLGGPVSGDATSGARPLTIAAGAGQVSFAGPVGSDARPLASLGITAGATTLGGDVTTTGAQTYGGPLELAASVGLATADANVTFGGAVTDDADPPGLGRALTVAAGAGEISFAGPVGSAARPLAGLEVEGSTLALAGDVTTTGDQSFAGPLTLRADAALVSTSGDVQLQGSVDGEAGAARPGLVVRAGAGTASFERALGQSQRLARLDVQAATIRLGGDVATQGAQLHQGAVELIVPVGPTGPEAPFRLTSQTSRLELGPVAGNGAALELVAATQVDLASAAGLAGLAITAPLIRAGEVQSLAAQAYDGATTLTGGRYEVSGPGGAFTIQGPLTLAASALPTAPLEPATVTIDTSPGGAPISLLGAIGGDRRLVLDAGGGAVTLRGPTTPAGASKVASLDVRAGVLRLGTALEVTAAGAGLAVAAPVTLLGDTRLVTAGGTLALDGGVEDGGGDAVLALDAGAGHVRLGGIGGGIGRAAPIAALTVDAATAEVLADVRTTGDQAWRALATIGGAPPDPSSAAPVAIAGAPVSLVTSAGGDVRLERDVLLRTTLVVTTEGAAADGDVALIGVGGGQSLVVRASGGRLMLGGDADLAGLSATARTFTSAGTTLRLGAPSTITTSAGGNAVILGAVVGEQDLAIRAGPGRVRLTQDASFGALNVTTAGLETLPGARLRVAGTSRIDTTGAGGDIVLNAQASGPGSLELDAGAGQVRLLVGDRDRDAGRGLPSATPLGALVARATGGISIGSEIYSEGDQVYDGPLTVQASSTIASLDGSLLFVGPVLPPAPIAGAAPPPGPVAPIDLTLIAAGSVTFAAPVGSGVLPFGTMTLAVPRVTMGDLFTDALVLRGVVAGDITAARIGGISRSVHLTPRIDPDETSRRGTLVNGCTIGDLFCTGNDPRAFDLSQPPTRATSVPALLRLGSAMFADDPLAFDPDAFHFLDSGNEELWAFPDVPR